MGSVGVCEGSCMAGCIGLGWRPWRGDEVAQVLACCQDDTTCALLVDKVVKAAQLSAHSSTWTTTSATRALWKIEESTNCLAWKFDGSQVLVITP